ncbi:major facilitator superfamily domain-containing protein [Abortiporus biennis]|nr:major facilitator superfamily domain-containing protein [Abortiporus biennis]
MATEQSPLLVPEASSSEYSVVTRIAEHEAIYRRFSPSQKRVILLLVSLAGLIPLFVSGTFIPSIPQIALDLHSTGKIISLAVSLSVATNSVGCLIWASYSGYYGRRPIYLLSLACQCFGSLGVSLARSVPELFLARFFQAFGSSSGLSVGLGVIGDIYKLEERGTASGLFFGAVLLGPALAPLAGGIASHYFSWRIMQGCLFIYAILMFITTLFFLPETSHPGTRGVEKVTEAGDKSRFVVINPFKCLALLRSPNALAGGFILMTDFVLLIPIAYTLGAKYHITNEAIIGACFMPVGVGNILGASLAGRISDKVVIKWEKIRGEWVPEDRLRGTTIIGALIFVPFSLLGFGIVTTYVDGPVGITLDLICLFLHGIGIDLVLSPSAAYNTDILHSQSAEAAATNMALRGVIVSITSSLILPCIETFGVFYTNAGAAVISWVGCILLWSVIKYGDRMRAWKDIGYSTALTN